ncbi:carboxylating nicotinate-nucleotide diphosphorylase [Tenuibacillus multivorans]|uniref:Probable nicotinate-nucleotide pyrophosphorylase [carboxylating] n=1 Tax=Tenuibacillus multivorans TaxID=237069 RepID=A0A1G9Z725_9BACI|nr:carboxylating nicotinate-nucleotide diphosphorylase [Tenuibacillus multivorans]GEL77404.1 nicotinate-nucleotide diphosphorylase (carboxylating) [Tenuibacillus multivorans]SDN16333.1 nicotinate-nucleotide pyrophosphorylase (carboxylating) [Tenuibacillus multivorans]
MNRLQLKKQLEHFFIEDLGYRDLTTDSIFDNRLGEVKFISKSDSYFCGQDVIKTGFHTMNPQIEVQLSVQDGDPINQGQTLAHAKGPIKDLLQAERVVLNLVQRMSGITTKTKIAVQLLNSQHTKISDTRKTTPGLRMLEKYAVTQGGGINHRFRLDDAVMIKDNHINFCGSISEAVKKVRENVGHMVKIEVEAENEPQVKEAIEAEVDCILLDNMDPNDLPNLLQLIPESILTEASGGISLEDLPKYTNLDLDVISLGCLTHQIEALDISVEVNL